MLFSLSVVLFYKLVTNFESPEENDPFTKQQDNQLMHMRSCLKGSVLFDCQALLLYDFCVVVLFMRTLMALLFSVVSYYYFTSLQKKIN